MITGIILDAVKRRPNLACMHALFLSEECGLGYADRETAQKCEDWCRKTGTCSLDITRKAVQKRDLSVMLNLRDYRSFRIQSMFLKV